MIKLSCPVCNTAFDVVEPAPARIACPRCDENVPATSLAPPEAHAVEVVEPRPREKPSRFWIVGLVIVALTVAAFVADSLWETKLPPTTAPTSDAHAATKPPLMLSSLRHLPADSQLVVAVQPAALAEYTHRKGKSVEIWADELGLPTRVLAEFRKLGLEPEAIDQFAVALPEKGLLPYVVLMLRKPLEDDTAFRQGLNAQPVVDRPGHFAVDLFRVPMEMKKIDDTTYRFVGATDHRKLDAAPAANLDHLTQGLRDSIGKIGPASFAWLATDAVRPDWSANEHVKLAAIGLPDLPKRLDKVQAAAFGLATEPELKIAVAVRSGEAGPLADRFRDKLTPAGAVIAVEGDWATATMPFDPPKDALAALRAAFDR